MKIYIVTREPFPNGMAATSRIRCYAGAIAEAGVDCEIIIYRRTERNGSKPMNTEASGECYSISYRYIGGTPLRRNSKIARFLDDRLEETRTLWYIKSKAKRGDIIFAYAGLDVKYCLRLCRFSHKLKLKFGIDLCELPYGSITETPASIKKRHTFEKSLLPKIDFVIPISDALERYARKFISTKCASCKIPIMVDYAKYDIKDESSKPAIPYIFHSGALTEQKDGILGMFEAFGRASQKLDLPVAFVLTGNKATCRFQKEIDDLIEKFNLNDRVIFTGYLDASELLRKIQEASLVIINKYDNRQNKYCFATKIGEYMAAGKALITTRTGEAVNWLHDGFDSIIVTPGDVEELAEAIIRILSDNELRNKLGQGAKETCRNSFDYKKYGKIMVSMFEKI
ncbi:MAG: glycosyltransferase [Bacteroidales bacterium]|nr:glycosyltransferase [Bacteroidales bacterium]